MPWIGGYRLEGGTSGPAAWSCATSPTDRPVELLDLGARLHADADGWLIGRLVPSGTTPALMFDTRPLPSTSRRRARWRDPDRRGAWLARARRGIHATGRVDAGRLMSRGPRARHRRGRAWPDGARHAARGPRGPPEDRLRRGRDEIGRAAYRILRAVGEGIFGGEEDAPYVAAAVVNPHGFAEA